MSLSDEITDSIEALMRAGFKPLVIHMGAVSRRVLTNEIIEWQIQSYMAASPEVRALRQEPQVGAIYTHFAGVPIELDLDDSYKVSIEVSLNRTLIAIPISPFDERAGSPSDVVSYLPEGRSLGGSSRRDPPK